MALLTKVGTFTINGSSTQVITGVGFQPKALLFMHTRNTGDATSNAVAAWSFGMATGTASTEQVVRSLQLTRSSAESSSASFNGGHVVWPMGGSYSNVSASLTAIGADGFTLTWNNTFYIETYIGDEVHYVAFGGDDVLNASVLNNQYFAAGNKTTTVGFEPNVLINLPVFDNLNMLYQGFGAVSDTNQWMQSSYAQHLTAGRATLKNDRAFYLESDTTSPFWNGTLSSFTATGYTFSTSTGTPTGRLWTLAMRLSTAPVVGTFEQSPSAGSQSVTTTGVEPKLVLLSSSGQSAGQTLNAFRISQAWTDGTNHTGFVLGARSGSAGGWQTESHTTPLLFANTQASSPYHSVDSRGSLALDNDGFTATWTQHDGVLREVAYIAFGEAAPTGETHEGSATLSGEASAAIDGARLRLDAMQADATTATNVIPSRGRADTVSIDGTASTDITAHADYSTALSVRGDAETVTIATRLRDADISLAGTIDTTLTPSRVRDSGTTLAATLTSAYDAHRLVDASAVLDGDLILITNADRLKSGTVLTSASLSSNAYTATRMRGGFFTTDIFHDAPAFTSWVRYVSVITLSGETGYVVLPDVSEGEDRYLLSASSTLAVNPNRIRIAQVGTSADLSVAPIIGLRGLSGSFTADISIDTPVYASHVRYDTWLDLTASVGLTTTSGILATGLYDLDAETTILVIGRRDREVLIPALHADLGTDIDGQRLRNGALLLTGTIDLDADPRRYRGTLLRNTGATAFVASPNADYNVRMRATSGTYLRAWTGRVRTDAASADAGMTIDIAPSRVRITSLPLILDSHMTLQGNVIADGGITAAQVISIEVIGYTTLDGGMDLTATSDLSAYATPILLVTYHDVYGTARQATAVGEVVPSPVSTSHTPRAKTRIGIPTPRVRHPRTR